jgi:flagellar biosynthesis regulator FlbT
MALKIELKPGERVIVGECAMTNCGQRARILVEGASPILREKDILTPATADTPAKRIYLAVQLMYMSRDRTPTMRPISPWCGKSCRQRPVRGRLSRLSTIRS